MPDRRTGCALPGTGAGTVGQLVDRADHIAQRALDFELAFDVGFGEGAQRRPQQVPERCGRAQLQPHPAIGAERERPAVL